MVSKSVFSSLFFWLPVLFCCTYLRFSHPGFIARNFSTAKYGVSPMGNPFEKPSLVLQIEIPFESGRLLSMVLFHMTDLLNIWAGVISLLQNQYQPEPPVRSETLAGLVRSHCTYRKLKSLELTIPTAAGIVGRALMTARFSRALIKELDFYLIFTNFMSSKKAVSLVSIL